jgi:hypothetical protein
MSPAMVPVGPLKQCPSALAAANQRKRGATATEIPVLEQERNGANVFASTPSLVNDPAGDLSVQSFPNPPTPLILGV